MLEEIASEILPLVIPWNAGYRSSGDRGVNTRGTSDWKQTYKNHFVYLTQFASDNPCQRKRQWKQDLVKAAELTVNEICPHWKTKTTDRVTYNLRVGSPQC